MKYDKVIIFVNKDYEYFSKTISLRIEKMIVFKKLL